LAESIRKISKTKNLRSAIAKSDDRKPMERSIKKNKYNILKIKAFFL
jgi:hypothetical protein